MHFLAETELEHLGFLIDLGVVLGAGVIASLLMATLRLPAVTGLLLAGAICGPFGFALVEDQGTINTLAEVGVVLLLFTIGLEFPLSRFLRIGKTLAIGGSLQVGLTSAAVIGACMLLGLEFKFAVPIGFAVALSSTAIVLRGLSDRGEVDAPHGRFIVGTLLFQDLCVIPMMLVLPVLAGSGTALDIVQSTAISLGLATAAVVLTYIVSRVLLPPLLRRVDKTRSRESFVLAILSICLGIALATGYAGLSLALGAFLAGIVLADSPFANRALTEVMPLRDVLTGLFFISLGMMFDWRALVEGPLIVGGVFLAIFFGKALLATIAAMVMRFPPRAAIVAGLGLAQFGEFGFVLLNNAAALDTPLFDVQGDGRWLWAAALITMFITPLVLRFSPHLAAGARLLKPLERLLGARGMDEPAKGDAGLSDHVVVAGYGVSGRMVVSALKTVGIPYLILEMNAETVRAAQAANEPAYYADVSSDEALHHARVEHARAFVLTINDPGAVQRSIDTVRRVAPNVPLLVRARYLAERDTFLKLGASEVVSGELEGAVEIMARVLRLMDIPRNLIDREVALVRERTQTSVREHTIPRATLAAFSMLKDLKIETFLVEPESSAAAKSLRDLNLRKVTGATVIAVSRGPQVMDNPAPTMPLQPGDMVYLLGSLEQVRDAICLLDTGDTPAQVAFATKVLHRHEVAPPATAPDGTGT
ncbi:MAG: cation:proton antiporter [Planctomycetes bacterium]|nr:cation:proton antiporter [Planctomycetota bacterium]